MCVCVCVLARRDVHSGSIVGSSELQRLALWRKARSENLAWRPEVSWCGVVRGKVGRVESSFPSRFFERGISIGQGRIPGGTG